MTRVLWLSRHKPLLSQVKELRKLFGRTKIIQKSVTIDSGQDLLRLMLENNCTEAVVILPVTLLQSAIECGVRPLIAVLDRNNGQHRHFKRLTHINVTLEDMQG